MRNVIKIVFIAGSSSSFPSRGQHCQTRNPEDPRKQSRQIPGGVLTPINNRWDEKYAKQTRLVAKMLSDKNAGEHSDKVAFSCPN